MFLEYGPLVKGICLRYAANPEEGEDLFQDVFVFILTHFKDFTKITSLKGWIYRIAGPAPIISKRIRPVFLEWGYVLRLSHRDVI